MRMLFRNYLLLAIFVLCQPTLVYPQSYSNLIQVGYYEGKPMFSDFKDNIIYCFDGNFRVFSDGIPGYHLVSCNDSVSAFRSLNNSNEIIINGTGYRKKVTLVKKPNWVAMNESGDTLYYTCEGDEVENIRVYSVREKKEYKGHPVDYESFWVRNGNLIYSITDEKNSEKVLIYADMDLNIKMTFDEKNVAIYLAISEDGELVIGKMKKEYGKKSQVIIVDIERDSVLRKEIEDHSLSFFIYNDKIYSYGGSRNEVEKVEY